MRSVGIDVASSGISALALVTNGNLVRAEIFKPVKKKDSEVTRLENFYRWIKRSLYVMKPDVVAVEQIAGYQNRRTIHALARFEGVALLAAKQSGAIALNPGIGQAREVVFGNGALSKDAAWEQFRKMYDFKLLAKNSGGTDQVDALTHALAALTILERR